MKATITEIKPSASLKNSEGQPALTVTLEWSGLDTNIQSFDIDQLGDVTYKHTPGRGFGYVTLDGASLLKVGDSIPLLNEEDAE